MHKTDEALNYHKIMGMYQEKRDRILNAAMIEFSKGYNKASTDAIVRAAGVSKGILFHYFNSKKELYMFLQEYAIQTLVAKYFQKINLEQRDILDRCRQITLLKIDLMQKYPSIFDFVHSVDLSETNEEGAATKERLQDFAKEMYPKIFYNVDTSLFREDLDPKKVIDVIILTLEGYASREASPAKNMADYEPEYDRYIKEVDEYIDFFQKSFYKQGE